MSTGRRFSVVEPRRVKSEDNAAEQARLLAFALCTADALIEVDVEGRIVDAFGPTDALFDKRSHELAAHTLESLVAEDDRHLLRSLLRQVGNGQRFRGASIRFFGPGGVLRTMILSGYGVPNIGEHCYLTLRTIQMSSADFEDPERNNFSGLRNLQNFSSCVSNYFSTTPEGSHQGGLTLLYAHGLSELRRRLLPAVWSQLQRQMGAFLDAMSIEGNAAGHLSFDRFGFIHDRTVDVDEVCARLVEFTRAADPENKGCDIIPDNIAVHEIDLAGPDLARAILYTTQRFANAQNNGVIGDATQSNVSRQLKMAADRTRYVVSTITGADFGIAYEPIVSLVDGSIHHYEALLRLSDYPSGFSPYEFIVFAEEIDLITEFDLAMCRKLIAKLSSQSDGESNLPVAVNISGRSINSLVFVEALNALIERHPRVRGRLMFEITESARILDLEHANEVIQDLRRRGFHVCLDDFGAGEAAFDYLRELEVDFVKIDGKYVKDAASNSRDKAFLIAMSGLCHDLGITTIAEGIENKAILDFLRGCGITYGQGYVFASASEQTVPHAVI
ncbi:MAG: EAL domain-containing protein [Alphaproteobacteria bacterium]|nr:EAL domain-containing protein [Alphaproteobacteria bacterium]